MNHFISSGGARTSKSVPWLPELMACMLLATPLFTGSVPAQNQVTFEVVDTESGEPVPARIEFTKSAKKLARDRKFLVQGDSWLAEGSLPFQPAPGDYEFRAFRGPEFHTVRGGFTIQPGSRDSILIEIPRSIDMHAEFWFSGDLDAELDPSQLARWQRADALDVVVRSVTIGSKTESGKANAPTKPEKTKQLDAPKLADPDQVGHGWMGTATVIRTPSLGLAVHRVPQGARETSNALSVPSEQEPYRIASSVLEDVGAVGEITQLWSRDVPILLANPKIRCARILTPINRPQKDDALTFSKSEKSFEFGRISMMVGKDRMVIPVLAPLPSKDRIRFQNPRGAGMLAEAIYWQALEAGIRLTPTAGSGFGQGDTHLGYNRVYACCDSEASELAWWRSVERGATFITNGPLLRALVNGAPPGAIQASTSGAPIWLDIAVSLSVREPVDYLDVIFNGETLYSAKLEDHNRRGAFPELNIDRSGWLVIRVITAHEDGYRFASTAPYYFEFDGQPRVSKQAVEFFQQWLERCDEPISVEGKTKVSENLASPARQAWIETAKRFWTEQLAKSNAP